MATCWKSQFGALKSKFSTSEQLCNLYDKLEPTTKKVIALINSNPENNAERDTLQYFKRYIRGLGNAELKHMLQFLTGSELIVVESLEVTFIKDLSSTFSRRPIVHICGPSLELSSSYNNFCELREEFCAIMKNSTFWLDIV